MEDRAEILAMMGGLKELINEKLRLKISTSMMRLFGINRRKNMKEMKVSDTKMVV